MASELVRRLIEANERIDFLEIRIEVSKEEIAKLKNQIIDLKGGLRACARSSQGVLDQYSKPQVIINDNTLAVKREIKLL